MKQFMVYTDNDGIKSMLALSDADFIRGLKNTQQEHIPIVRAVNERIEKIAAGLER